MRYLLALFLTSCTVTLTAEDGIPPITIGDEVDMGDIHDKPDGFYGYVSGRGFPAVVEIQTLDTQTKRVIWYEKIEAVPDYLTQFLLLTYGEEKVDSVKGIDLALTSLRASKPSWYDAGRPVPSLTIEGVKFTRAGENHSLPDDLVDEFRERVYAGQALLVDMLYTADLSVAEQLHVYIELRAVFQPTLYVSL